MKCPAAFAVVLTVAACSSTQAPRPDTGSLAAQEAPAYSREALATPVQVDITAATNADTVECRRSAPTGTRIAVNQCEPTAQNDTATTTRDQMLRDIEEIRRRQWQLEAMRQNGPTFSAGQGAAAPAPSPSP